MDNFKFRMFDKNEQIFIMKYSLYENIGKPMKINGDTYYPILDRELFLRYYITYAGYIYDITQNKVKRFNINDSVILITTNSNSRKLYSVKELIWLSFYRFSKGRNLPSIGEKIDIEVTQHFEKATKCFYTINGIEFRKVIFPKDSIYYKATSSKNRHVLITSENGAIFDLHKRRFIMINIDDNGIPYINAKKNIRINLEKLLAYSWGYSSLSSKDTCEIINFSHIKIFVDINSIGIRNDNKIIPLSNSIVAQNINMFPIHRESYNELTCDQLGRKCQIPINGLSDYNITKSGVIFYQNNKIMKPHNIIFGNNGSIIDVIYKFPNIDRLFTISDILLWTYYRLNYDTVSKIYSDIIFHDKIGIPIVLSLSIISKPYTITDSQLIVGSSLFIKMNNFKNLFISTNGAIFNSKHQYFICIDNHYRKDIMVINLPNGNVSNWIDINRAMFETWYGSIPTGLAVSNSNNIKGDYRLTNLKLSPSIRTDIIVNIGTIKNRYAALELFKERQIKTLKKVYGNDFDTKKIYELPILEVIEI